MWAGEGCSVISDTAGNLMFYTNGNKVWDSTHTVMPNGDSLWGHTSSSQSAIIIGHPGNNTQYFIFTVPDVFDTNRVGYSIVDMTLNGGLGDVSVKNTLLYTGSTEKLTAIKHSNGTDVWVITHKQVTDTFYTYLVTAFGVNPVPVISVVGTPYGNNILSNLGCMKTSTDGTKLAAAVQHNGFLEIYDFNTSTGAITNSAQLGNWPTLPNGPYGVEFSPDGTKLYVSFSGPNIVMQYNMAAGSTAAIIASCDTIYQDNLLAACAALQNGPDGRMYLSYANAFYLHCITNPNLQGAACNFTLNYIPLAPNRARLGLPNFISSMFNSVVSSPNEAECCTNTFSLYPNPACTRLSISLGTNISSATHITIVNSLGAKVYYQNIPAGNTESEVTIPVNNFSKGVYFVSVRNRDGVETKKFVIN